MLANNKVTIFRYKEEKDDYEPVLTCPAWVFRKNGLSRTVKGEGNADVIHIRIERMHISDLEKGDLVYVGVYDKLRPPSLTECRKITKLTDNNYGSVPHWHIETEA